MNYVFNKKTYNSTMVYHTLYIYMYTVLTSVFNNNYITHLLIFLLLHQNVMQRNACSYIKLNFLQ